MNEGQEKFYHFILERVQDDKQEEAKRLLNNSFKKQADGSFDTDYLQSFISQMVTILKPESVDEVKRIMMNFKQ